MAFIRINQIKDADGSIEPDELELANDIIEAMMITRKGSIPGSRGYGLTQIFIDMPGPDAINMITVELAEAMDEYIPSLELQDIKGTQDEEGVPERCLSRMAGIVRCCPKRRYSGNHLVLLYLTLHAERTNRHQYQSPTAAYPFLSIAGGAADQILTAGLPCTTLRLPLCRRQQNPAYSPSGNPVSG